MSYEYCPYEVTFDGKFYVVSFGSNNIKLRWFNTELDAECWISEKMCEIERKIRSE